MALNHSYSPSPTATDRHQFYKSPPPMCSSRSPLPRCRLSFPRHSTELDEKDFKPSVFNSPNLLHSSLDLCGYPFPSGLHAWAQNPKTKNYLTQT
ncbi:hypothetical protein GQ457_02G042640 [Hibiscus cannabinus]